jgi:peroxiredoxin
MCKSLATTCPILSEKKLELTQAMNLPTFQTDGMMLLKRLTPIIDDCEVTRFFYPVFPPDRSASDVHEVCRSLKERFS